MCDFLKSYGPADRFLAENGVAPEFLVIVRRKMDLRRLDAMA